MEFPLGSDLWIFSQCLSFGSTVDGEDVPVRIGFRVDGLINLVTEAVENDVVIVQNFGIGVEFVGNQGLVIFFSYRMLQVKISEVWAQGLSDLVNKAVTGVMV
eukprot:CAMPEP_0184295748 /NCGR_PEP_ID=MMETSP1049-20130417/6627_1 /TAXON_ID=77928 /ORGANISM="Proteomonas sulcata, Strain CCMP704" /LENGTH=102 /DNA_ID=CAMNT_0026604481 /DNA_START=831 /DNA_END=1136 /DNA_ORIENTATION=-